MLYNLEGTPEVTYTEKFSDIPEGEWYTNAVIWAAENGITSGLPDGRFGKYEQITREQMALMIMKCVKVKGFEISGTADLSKFTDAEDISDWAVDAMSWAVANNIITGTPEGKLNPKGAATRAEGATMLCKLFDKFY